jgi:hypothetical protein
VTKPSRRHSEQSEESPAARNAIPHGVRNDNPSLDAIRFYAAQRNIHAGFEAKLAETAHQHCA